MIVEYVGEAYKVSLSKGKHYETDGIDHGLYFVVDETGERYGFPASEFKVVEQ